MKWPVQSGGTSSSDVISPCLPGLSPEHPSAPPQRIPFTARLMLLSISLLTAALAIATPAPAFADLEFCNRTTDQSTLSVALAHYNVGFIHKRFRRDGSTGLTITVNPRWTIKGWWEIPHNECITTATDRDPNLKHYYYYAHSQDGSYADSGSYPLCGRKDGRFHVEYQMDRDNKPVQILALAPSGVRSVPANSIAALEAACASLGYRLLPFNQLDVEGNQHYTHEIF